MTPYIYSLPGDSANCQEWSFPVIRMVGHRRMKRRITCSPMRQNLKSSGGGKLSWPLPKKYPITSNFGSRVDPITGKSGENHKGLDIGAPSGTSILAAESGTVIIAEYWNGYGNTVVLDHGNGLWTLYPHIRMNGIKVKKGDTVKRDQVIAEVGSTGRSTGPHLHFEVRVNGIAVNPAPYLKQ
jgi:murein DD-endopeptidase MepM/ murein hydrolase activator NlpD